MALVKSSRVVSSGNAKPGSAVGRVSGGAADVEKRRARNVARQQKGGERVAAAHAASSAALQQSRSVAELAATSEEFASLADELQSGA